MYNQNLEFSAAAGLTLSCKLFTLGSDTVVATSTATEKVNDKNRYIASYTDIPAGAYRLNAFASGIGGFANEVYDITLSSQTFYPRGESKVDTGSIAAAVWNENYLNYQASGSSFGYKVVSIGTAPIANMTIERSLDDDKAITFAWPASGVAISGQKSVDNGTYSPVSGAINYIRTENSKYYYALSYNSADRVNEEATIRYKMDDGTYTKYFNLRLVPPGVTAQQIESALQSDFDAITERTLPSGQYLNTSSPVTVTALTQSAVEDIFSTYTLSEDYAASGQMGTPAQILYFMQQTFSQFAISGVYISVKKLDGTTEAAKFIMNDKEAPTSRTRIL